ncbi:nucleoporin complex subunit 54-domain-containing protein [Umbelopsis sp. PMI_123]|nr:nucleoporin complex subunit 54-domain-containing protein [Umbelopsis sp. PMI_123]
MAFTFGSKPATSTASPFGGGFGTNTGGSFGSTSTAPAASNTFSFGNASTVAPATSTTPSFGFGASAAPATSTAPSFGFGNNTSSTNTTNLFASSLFGNTAGTSLFGSKPTTLGGTGSMFGAQQPTIGQVWQYLSQQEQSAQQLNQRLLPGQHANPQYIWQSLALIKTLFYNIVHPSEVQRFTKPPNEDDKAWEMAMKNNPDPSCMVPVRAVGFEALRTRIETQDKQSQAHRIKLEKMKEVRRKHTIETVVKLQEYKRRHIDLTQRVIQFLKYAQILRNKGFSIESDEEALRAKLENVQSHLHQSEQFHGKLNQLWAQLQLVRESNRIYGGTEDGKGWTSISEKDMETISRVLEDQQNGLAHVMKILREDVQDAIVLSQALQEQSK